LLYCIIYDTVIIGKGENKKSWELPKPKGIEMADSYLERIFLKMVSIHKLPQPVREYNFHNFRFDFCWPQIKVAVEIDGGTFNGGAHVKGKGYQRDCIKSNLAHLENWVILRADREMVVGTKESEEFYRHVKLMIRIRVKQKKTGRVNI
jgi:very-short-patch-repair endonuclease